MISISNDTLLVTSLAYLCFLALVLQLYKLFLRDFFIERKQSYAMKPLKLPRFENNGQSGVIYIFDDFLTKYRMIPMNLPRKRLKNKRTSSESPNFAARSLEENIPLTLFPYLPGCEPDGKAALQMQKLFPTVSRLDIVRFLVARKGNISLASEMLKKARDWKNANIPAKRSLVENVYKTGCFISKGYAKDGSPVVYFRWGLYDTNKASFEAYVLAAAHLIEFLVKDHSRFVNATIVIDLSVVKDGSNGPTDMNFIKLLVQTLSDNMPERLNRLIVYPFPWYGRTIWTMIKLFVDKRTQDKVIVFPPTEGVNSLGGTVPEELGKYVPLDEVPICCGGTCTDPPFDILSSLTD